ncbi:MAG: NUDIX hydrolase [Bacteroidia bacterium]|nr:NUDIX hydrolase [Bacteroidia bacterium]
MPLYEPQHRFFLAVDCIIFGFDGQGLHLLLVKRGFEPAMGQWSLMGGFVQPAESTDEAALRVLYRLTGLRGIYLEQLGAFGAVDRDPEERVVSIAYFALINMSEYQDQDLQSHKASWFSVSEYPDLVFDHGVMVEKARERLKEQAAIQPIGFELLPHKFTLPELRRLYEAILETTLDLGNFTRRMQNLGILRKLDEKQRGSSKKGAFYYMFDREAYRQRDREGLPFAIK